RWSRPGHPVYVPVPRPGAEVRIGEERFAGPACSLINKAGTFMASDGILGDVGDSEPDDGRFDEPGEYFFASGTAVALRAETFARVGGLAEPLFAYFEDADWSWRARLAGLRVLYDPGAVVDHRQSATSGGWATQWVRRWVPANHAACLLRNAPLPQAYRAVRRHLEEVRHDQARLALVSRIPWALGTRPQLARSWAVSPGEVWDRWAGVGAPAAK
ncbi:MAG: glycosyltransferase family 2 protein, partial [Acidimicrobiales bacterium]